MKGASWRWPVGAALIMMQTSAILYADFMNVIILGMHEKLGYTLQIAGDISSLNLACTAFGALAGALFARRLTGGRCSVVYIAAIAVLDALSIFVTPWQALAVLRGLHGLACGGLLASCGAALSRWPRPERIMGASLAIQLALASLGALFFPSVIRQHGLGIVFLVMTIVELATAALVLYTLADFSSVGQAGDGAPRPASALPARVRVLCCASMFALFLFQFSRFMVVGYGFQIGDFFALPRPFVGSAIAVSNWLAGAGAVIATALPRRMGRTWPLLLAGTGNLLGAFALISFGTDPWVFAVATGVSALLTFIALPYLYGVCFAIDRGGAWGTWTGFVSKLGLALGPASGALLMAHHSLPAVLRISVLLVFAAILLACWPARRIDRAPPWSA
jgi:MFS family permease